MHHLSSNWFSLDVGAGLITEARMSLRTVIESSESELQGKIRILNGRSDMFALKFNPGTNTLEILDLKPEATFDTDDPGSHFVNHFMQLIAYALTVQAELGDEVNIRCIVFNKKGFVQFDPNLMYFTFLEFLTNLYIEKGGNKWKSNWNAFAETFVYSLTETKNAQDYKDGYLRYENIRPTKKYMKAFIDLYPHVRKETMRRKSLGTTPYLTVVEKVLDVFRAEVQYDYLNP
jgi:hypothetical protein